MPFLKDPDAKVSAKTKAIEWIRSTPLPDYVKNTAENIVREVDNEARVAYETESTSSTAFYTTVHDKLKIFSCNTTISEFFIDNLKVHLYKIVDEVIYEVAEKVHS